MVSGLLNNRYRILETVGSGGFGTTFLAEDTHMPSGRQCAIKQLKPIAHDPKTYEFVQDRFRREAAILEKLGEGSTQIPRLYAYFSEGDRFYLVQEWIEGATLSHQVQLRGLLDEAAVVSLLLNLLPVLDYLHREGIIHRDLKPDNLILRKQDGMPVLIDFGAIKETMGTAISSQGQPANTVIVGTPGFMPPEQAAGRPNYTSDLYSLGLTAIYALTGKSPQELPTDLRTGEILWQQQSLVLSPAVLAVLDRSVRAHARDRYASANEMHAALQGIAPAGGTLAGQAGVPSSLPTMAVSPGAAYAPPTATSNVGTMPVALPASRERQFPWPIFLGVAAIAIAIGSLVAISPSFLPGANTTQTDESDSPAEVAQDSQPSPPREAPTEKAPSNEESASPSPTDEPVAAPAGEEPSPDPATADVPAATSGSSARPDGFSVGTTESTVRSLLGDPSRQSQGLWRTRALTYQQGDRTLGLLFDRTSRRLRQTEAAFDSTVAVGEMEQTLSAMLKGEVSAEAREALQQIHQRQRDEYRFSQGGVKGTIVRNHCDRIYIGVWDASLHGFLDAKGC